MIPNGLSRPGKPMNATAKSLRNLLVEGDLRTTGRVDDVLAIPNGDYEPTSGYDVLGAASCAGASCTVAEPSSV